MPKWRALSSRRRSGHAPAIYATPTLALACSLTRLWKLEGLPVGVISYIRFTPVDCLPHLCLRRRLICPTDSDAKFARPGLCISLSRHGFVQRYVVDDPLDVSSIDTVVVTTPPVSIRGMGTRPLREVHLHVSNLAISVFGSASRLTRDPCPVGSPQHPVFTWERSHQRRTTRLRKRQKTR